jgi:hypothetical protein
MTRSYVPPDLLGNFTTPRVGVGHRLLCAVRGRVTVGGFSRGTIPGRSSIAGADP